jgi:hypothetical protein
MSDTPQQRALRNYRQRLAQKGQVRFDVMGRTVDRDLIRELARRLAEQGADADHLRAQLRLHLEGEQPPAGGILSALRASPLVGSGIDLQRLEGTGRHLDL